MSAALAFAQQANAFSVVNTHQDVVLVLAKKVQECALFIREYARTTGFLRRAAKGLFADVNSDIDRLKNDFNILRQNLDTGAILSVTKMVKEGFSNVRSDLVEAKEAAISADHQSVLNQLKVVATWDSGHVCLENTRVSVLNDIIQWVHNVPEHGSNTPYFLSGGAGTGKSSVANSLAARYDSPLREIGHHIIWKLVTYPDLSGKIWRAFVHFFSSKFVTSF